MSGVKHIYRQMPNERMHQRLHADWIAPSIVSRFHGEGSPGSDEKAFVELLTRQAESLRIYPVQAPHDVMLDERGFVQGRFRFSRHAVSRLCQTLCPGLGAVVSNLVVGDKIDRPDAPTSSPMALRLINDMIKLRFTLLSRTQMLVDITENRIEGLVGRKYPLLPHAELYQLAKQLAGSPCCFEEAIVCDRRLFLRFVSRSPLCSVKAEQGEDRFFRGYHFSSSELGELAVHVGTTLAREWSGTHFLSPFNKQTSTWHIGRVAWADRLRRAFDYAKQARLSRSQVQAKIQELRSTEASWLQGGVVNKDGNQKFQSRLRRALHPAAIVSPQIAKQLLTYHSYMLPSQTAQPLRPSRTVRTLYDLCNVMGLVAHDQVPYIRERVEQAAYRLLSGELTF